MPSYEDRIRHLIHQVHGLSDLTSPIKSQMHPMAVLEQIEEVIQVRKAQILQEESGVVMGDRRTVKHWSYADYDVVDCSHVTPHECEICHEPKKEFVILEMDDTTQQKMCVSCYEHFHSRV